MQMFIDGVRKTLDDLAAGRIDGDAVALRRAVHTLKSSAAQVGALAFSAEAERQEHRLRTGAPAHPDGAARLQKAFARFETALDQHRQCRAQPLDTGWPA